MADDPYVYPGTDVLINRLDIRDKDDLRAFEIEATYHRLSRNVPTVPMTPSGYRELHWHIFQDVYAWAGQLRTVDLAKENTLFCRPEYIEAQLTHRFDLLKSQSIGPRTPADLFAKLAAEHISELNVIHPFREGNGRTNRAFLQALGREARHPIHLENISPDDWMLASKESFQTTNTDRFERLISKSMEPPGNEPFPDRSPSRGRGP